MSKIDANNLHVVGDSLAACLYANVISEKYISLTMHTTGKLGGVNFDGDGHPRNMMLPITEDVKSTLLARGVENKFMGPFSTRYVSVPYDKLKIKNKANGDIQWPFNKDSFEASDWNSILYGIEDFDEMVKDAEKLRNAPAVLRKRLPSGFYTSVIKRMGVNLYCNPHGQIDPASLINDVLRLDTIYSLNSEKFYIYAGGITDICRQLLKKTNIIIVEEPIHVTRNFIRKRSDLFHIMERHDYYLDYVAGSIDYISYDTIKAIKNDDMDYMIRYTPYEKYSIKYTYNHISYEATSKQSYSNDTKIHCVQAPTIKTMRAMDEYRELAKITPSVRLL